MFGATRWLFFLLCCALLLVACGDESAAGPGPAPTATTPPGQRFVLQRAFESLQFGPLVEIGAFPDGRMFVAEQTGVVSVIEPAASTATVLLDIRDRVDSDLGEGLLSVALDPQFGENGHIWAFYFTAGESATVLSRFDVVDGAADRDSELRVLHLEQPGYNQNGGAIRFGPDGMLYLSLGDGSASIDPFKNGQNTATLLATVIRIDVRTATEDRPYVVPSDNPFVDHPDFAPEIWAYGLRNPWRMAFDPETGELWLGDVGVSEAEEVNRIERGGNYGWSLKEGFDCLSGRSACGEGLTDPVATYTHEDGRCSVIGGVVYRGALIEPLQGTYLLADHCMPGLMALVPGTSTVTPLVADGPQRITSFGTNEAGEVYVVDYDGGIWKLTRSRD